MPTSNTDRPDLNALNIESLQREREDMIEENAKDAEAFDPDALPVREAYLKIIRNNHEEGELPDQTEVNNRIEQAREAEVKEHVAQVSSIAEATIRLRHDHLVQENQAQDSSIATVTTMRPRQDYLEEEDYYAQAA